MIKIEFEERTGSEDFIFIFNFLSQKLLIILMKNGTTFFFVFSFCHSFTLSPSQSGWDRDIYLHISCWISDILIKYSSSSKQHVVNHSEARHTQTNYVQWNTQNYPWVQVNILHTIVLKTLNKTAQYSLRKQHNYIKTNKQEIHL